MKPSIVFTAVAVMTSACASQLDDSAIELSGDELQLRVAQPDEQTCGVVETGITVKVNGRAVGFSDRGGGSCAQYEVTGQSILNFWPTSSKPSKMWICQCRPAVIDVTPTADALDVELCDGERCGRAQWPAPTPLPGVTVAPRADAAAPLVIGFTPALPARELMRMAAFQVGEGTLEASVTGWSEGQLTVPARWANERATTLVLHRSETLVATTCEGLGFCVDRASFLTARVELSR